MIHSDSDSDSEGILVAGYFVECTHNNSVEHTGRDRGMNDLERPILEKDTRFLCRCALTYNWDALIRFCSLLASSKTGVVVARHHLEGSDQWGNTTLHAACYNRPPVQVVASILNLAAAVASCAEKESDSIRMMIHLKRARDGSTPLQVACACGASVQVIRALLEAPYGGTVVAAADNMGATPLSDLVVQYELERKSTQHVRGSLPLSEVGTIVGAAPVFTAFWTKVELLLQKAWSGSGGYISILHGTAHVAESCPQILIDLICRLSLHFASFSDDSGMLPLHVALSKKDRELHLKSRGRRSYMVQKLLEVYPEAAAVPVDQRSALCYALGAGLHWHTRDGTKGPIHSLWRLCPSKLNGRDEETGFLPFMLAAMRGRTVHDEEAVAERTASGSRLNDDVIDDLLCLDTIFNLVRLDPRLLKVGL
jgi:hypothetical protein